MQHLPQHPAEKTLLSLRAPQCDGTKKENDALTFVIGRQRTIALGNVHAKSFSFMRGKKAPPMIVNEEGGQATLVFVFGDNDATHGSWVTLSRNII